MPRILTSPLLQAGGKLIVTVAPTIRSASPGAQLDYYQSVIDRHRAGMP